MNTDKVNQLVTKFPIVFAKLKDIECSDGWFNLIYSLCSLIEHRVSVLPLEMQEQIYAEQIKSKFGGLRAYFSHTTPVMDGAIELAEDLSNCVCEHCGECGSHKTIGGWITTLCELHYTEEMVAVSVRREEKNKTLKEQVEELDILFKNEEE